MATLLENNCTYGGDWCLKSDLGQRRVNFGYCTGFACGIHMGSRYEYRFKDSRVLDIDNRRAAYTELCLYSFLEKWIEVKLFKSK